MYKWSDDLDEALLAHGIPFTAVGRAASDRVNAPDWRTRGRPTNMQYNPTGILCHHTASPVAATDQSELNVILWGNSEAPGPISQILIGRSGILYLVAAGRCNHAGSGLAPWLGTQKIDGNAAMIGIEVSNSGLGERWPDKVVDIYARCVAALLDYYGFPISNVLIHHDFAQPYYPGSKIDPSGPWLMQPDLPGGARGTWDISTWRSYVQTKQGHLKPEPPVPTERDDDMRIGPYLIQATGADGTPNGRVYATDGNMMTLRYLGPSPEALKGYRWSMRNYGVSAPELEDNAGILAVDTIAAYGEVITHA